MKAFKEYRKRKLHHDLNQHDTNNIRAIKAIEGVDPKYAKHMFLGNRLLEQFIKKQGGGLDLLDQPVCPHCEKALCMGYRKRGLIVFLVISQYQVTKFIRYHSIC